ncbi:VWA domain-containing protein [uncultured Ilyobacter sp.]|uniref:vWA domain-containing protein n=1 Tax=uncultured Ilyobacter sp. TaxID=544433 RepID=UPI0029C6B8F8|nr:VWA domain-containing protein [uncultured Ilyobacter sp.]
MYKLKDTYFLIFLLPVIWLFFRKRKKNAIRIPSLGPLKAINADKNKKHLIGKYLIFTGIVLLILGLSRPQKTEDKIKREKNGIDIALVLDISKSMLTEDFNPNRLEKAKEVMETFISRRNQDRIGLVVFAGSAYTRVPLTFDYNVVKESLVSLSIDDIADNSRTAIGMGTATAINRLKKSSAKSKIIILVTDGENNFGEISPENAVTIANEMGIKIYTIGLGAEYIRQHTLLGPMKIKNDSLDETLLNNMAKDTGGQYFRADDEKKLETIFKKIDTLEKSKIESREIYLYRELYRYFVIGGLLFLITGLWFDNYRYIHIP